MLSHVEMGMILLAVMALLLAAGLWVGIVLAAVGAVAIAFFGKASIFNGLPVALWGSVESWELAALPLFVWMGEVLFRTKLSDQMFAGLAPWVNWIPGRLMHVNVIACGLFGSVSGSSAATTATVAKAALPELLRRGYDERVCLGSLCGAGTLGILIPPSITMVIYAVAAEVSIVKLFLAGFLPGFLIMLLFSGYIAVWALLNPAKTPRADANVSGMDRLRSLKDLVPVTLLIVFVMWMLVAGVATATESAAFGLLGALMLAFVSGTLSWANFRASLMGAMRVSVMIMFILACAAFLTKAMAYTGIPREMALWIKSMQLSPVMLIAGLTVVYIILGTALDGVSMIVLTTAIVIPMVHAAGIDLIWFGIFVILLVEISEVTPPVGFNLYVLQAMSGRDSTYVARAAIPFFFLLVLAIALITLFPEIVMWLPDRIMGADAVRKPA